MSRIESNSGRHKSSELLHWNLPAGSDVAIIVDAPGAHKTPLAAGVGNSSRPTIVVGPAFALEPYGRRETGADPIPAGSRFAGNDGPLPRL